MSRKFCIHPYIMYNTQFLELDDPTHIYSDVALQAQHLLATPALSIYTFRVKYSLRRLFPSFATASNTRVSWYCGIPSLYSYYYYYCLYIYTPRIAVYMRRLSSSHRLPFRSLRFALEPLIAFLLHFSALCVCMEYP